MCSACQQDRHSECAGVDEITGIECDCPQRLQEQSIQRSLQTNRNRDSAWADRVFRDLMSANSDLIRFFTDNAGEPRVRLLIQHVLSTAQSFRN